MTVAVLGAGAGGLAATVELTRAGHDVRLWNRNPARLQPHRGSGIRYSGVWGDGSVQPAALTDNLDEALAEVDAVVVCLPSVVHPLLFADLAAAGCRSPIVLNPGHTGGALHLRQVFTRVGTVVPSVAEFSTLTYVGRVNDGVVNITGRAGHVNAGALPGGGTALEWATRLFPGAEPVGDVLASSLANVNLVLHPPGAILGAAWVEATNGDFTFYVDGMTPGVARVVEKLDSERLAVARAFGHVLPSLLDEMMMVGTVDPEAAARGDTLAAIRGGVANSTISAPDSLDHRYYREDFAFGLLPFIALAETAGVSVPVANALLQLGSTLAPDDIITQGLGAGQLGIAGLSCEELIGSVTL